MLTKFILGTYLLQFNQFHSTVIEAFWISLYNDKAALQIYFEKHFFIPNLNFQLCRKIFIYIYLYLYFI